MNLPVGIRAVPVHAHLAHVGPLAEVGAGVGQHEAGLGVDGGEVHRRRGARVQGRPHAPEQQP